MALPLHHVADGGAYVTSMEIPEPQLEAFAPYRVALRVSASGVSIRWRR